MKDLSYFECRRNLERLQEFRELVVTYFKNVSYEFGFEVSENEQARKARQKINLKLTKITTAFYKTPATRSIYYSPPPAVGGFAGTVELLGNIFNLNRFQISPQILIDAIEQAIGFYEDELPKALIRTVNPFAWIYKILSLIIAVPFSLVELAGFDASAIQRSLVGRIIKALIELIVLSASFLTALYYLGYLNAFKRVFGLS